ncbi:hypothetical protein O7626_40510 [Micromonospora sp. WMMD1102]|uniref:hypothetical protein n=1 Tax=Micromonospora sp. WMMD1102 TaxID=3016105 RepID=UPI002414DB65|nr:hypothetical protein [Micromonospora sp. WMMD1102]MDG4792100.1 hypothetical protein [Micromonospora sp. WMMD1102]
MTDTSTDRWHLEKVVSPRGFASLPDIPSEYGGAVSVSESSAADGPHIWVRANAPVDPHNPYGDTRESAMHLTADNAARLAEQLEEVVVGHYQNDGEREMTGAEAKAAVQRVRDLCDRALADPGEAAGGEWEDPTPIPGWVTAVRRALNGPAGPEDVAR